MTMNPQHVREVLNRGGLYVLTGANLARGRTHRQIVEAALAGGADLIQLRDKSVDARTYMELAADLQPRCEQHGVPFIVNDRVDVALAAGAEGVHLGQGDMPVAAARALATAAGRPEWLIGLSTHGPQEGERGQTSGADYLGVGPIFPTKTKDYHVGIGYVRWASEHLRIPWTVSGGVNASRLREIAEAGARWIVIIEAINAADDITAATRHIKQLWQEAQAALERPEVTS